MTHEEFEFNLGEEEMGETEKTEADPLKKPKEEWETDEEGFVEPEEDFSSDFLPAEEESE